MLLVTYVYELGGAGASPAAAALAGKVRALAVVAKRDARAGGRRESQNCQRRRDQLLRLRHLSHREIAEAAARASAVVAYGLPRTAREASWDADFAAGRSGAGRATGRFGGPASGPNIASPWSRFSRGFTGARFLSRRFWPDTRLTSRNATRPNLRGAQRTRAEETRPSAPYVSRGG
jgi:hypothetical protein